MTPRIFLYVVLIVFAAVAAAFGYRLHKDGQCCGTLPPIADSDRQTPSLAQARPKDRLPPTRPATDRFTLDASVALPSDAITPNPGNQP